MTARELPEWIGSSPDATVPPRVRVRIFERYEGVCHLSGRKITPSDQWDLDHIVALCNGGQHREKNLAPAIRAKHREKTSDDVALKATTYKKKSKHIGIKRPRTIRSWRRFNGDPVYATRERS